MVEQRTPPASPRTLVGVAGEWVGARGPTAAEILAGLVRFPALVWRWRDLVRAELGRDLRARFHGTVLGPAWPLLQPLLFFAVWGFLFTRLFAFRMPDLPASQGAALGVYMFLGATLWTGIAEGLSRATTSIVDQGHLVRRQAFPAELLPLSAVLSGLVQTGFGVLAFAALALLTPVWIAPGAALAWVPLIALLQVLLTLGLGLFLAALHVSLRDTRNAVGILLTVAMLATPVFWVPSAEVLPSLAAWLPWVELNPLHHLLQAWRLALMSGEPAFGFTGTIASSLARLVPWAIACFALGYATFLAARRGFADEV